jgi:hypothetical protein
MQLLGVVVRDLPLLFQGNYELLIHRRLAFSSPRGGFPRRQALASASPEVFSPSAFKLRRAVRLCHKLGRSRFSVQVRRAVCWPHRTFALAVFRWHTWRLFRHTCAGSTRIMHRRSPVRRCSATRPNVSQPCRLLQIRQRSWGSRPFAALLLPAGSSAFRARAPTCRFSRIPPR